MAISALTYEGLTDGQLRDIRKKAKEIGVTSEGFEEGKKAGLVTNMLHEMKVIQEHGVNLAKLKSRSPSGNIGPVWIRFSSQHGRRYYAVHVFNHPTGPYILLTSPSMDRGDFARTSGIVALGMDTSITGSISDRSDDICSVLPFTRDIPANIAKWMVDRFENFYSRQFSNAIVYN